MNSQEFIDLLASKLDNCPVLKSLAIAQACLESGFGKRSFYNNIYGIKCHDPNKYAGCRLGRTSEVIDGSYVHGLHLAFQTYDSIDDSIHDYCRLMNISRYKRVREATNYLEATLAIKNCGYATSLSYVESLRRIINQYDLTRYDGGVMDKQLTKNFKLSEFSCRGQLPPEKYHDNIQQVAEELQKVRDILNRPIVITSGWRSVEHNKAVGGASRSMHLTGKACDSHMVGVNLYEYLTYLVRFTNFTGIGVGNPRVRGGNLIHSDIRHGDDLEKFTVWVY